jgi:hypothetical protein
LITLVRAVASATLLGALALAGCGDDGADGETPATTDAEAFDLQSCMDGAETVDDESACQNTEADIKLAVRRECIDHLGDNDAWEDCNAEVRADAERWQAQP